MPKSRVKIKVPTIRHKDLSADGVFGYAHQDDFEIELDSNHPSDKEYLNSLIHELNHCFLPDLREGDIVRLSDITADIIWKMGYRKKDKKNIELKAKQKLAK